MKNWFFSTQPAKDAGPAGDTAAAVTFRRKHLRLDCRLPIEFKIKSSGAYGAAEALNLGLGGTRIDLPLEVNLPEEIELLIPWPPAPADTPAPAPIKLTGRVVWTVAERIGGPFPTGLQFAALDDVTRRNLFNLLATLNR